jgi:hypothetical protein
MSVVCPAPFFAQQRVDLTLFQFEFHVVVGGETTEVLAHAFILNDLHDTRVLQFNITCPRHAAIIIVLIGLAFQNS